MKSKYGWSVNPYKLEKAIETVGDKDEEKIKAEYVRLGGLVRSAVNREFVPAKPLYPWAANKSKLDRAILKVGNKSDEEAIKKEYLALGGLILKTNESTAESPVVAPKTKEIKPAK